MRATKSVLAIVLGGAAAARFVAGCGEDTGGFVPDPPDGSVVDVQTDAPWLHDGGDDGSVCPSSCSSDLHKVYDCHGEEIRTCPDDQGCHADTGECVPACEAASAARATFGCEFYATAPAEHGFLGPARTAHCYAAFVANTWSTPVTLRAEFAGQKLTIDDFARIPSGSGGSITYTKLTNGVLPPGQVAILFLVNGVEGATNCPANADLRFPEVVQNVDKTSLTDAFRITADRPVAAYDIYPYGGGAAAETAASLLLATSAWDTNYMPVHPYGPEMAVQFVAKEDDTELTIVPTTDIVPGVGIEHPHLDIPTTYTLNKGQLLQFYSYDSLAGSVIESTKPIGMWVGAPGIMVDAMYYDTAHQQIAPIRALGSEYVAVRYRNRADGFPEESVPWRIMGLLDDTTLTYEPAPPPGAPTTINAGQVVKFYTAEPFVVRSQDEAHPFYVSAHMTGCSSLPEAAIEAQGCMGDAEFVNVVPAKQFLSRYVFFTDPTYSETNLVVVRARKDGAFSDVILDCAGPLGGWQPVGEYEYTRIDLVRGNFAPQVYDGGTCDNGGHEIRSDAPFGVTVWAWGSKASGTSEDGGFYTECVSYAYPAGHSARRINEVVIPPVPK